jgi:hypothetical protein
VWLKRNLDNARYQDVQSYSLINRTLAAKSHLRECIRLAHENIERLVNYIDVNGKSEEMNTKASSAPKILAKGRQKGRGSQLGKQHMGSVISIIQTRQSQGVCHASKSVLCSQMLDGPESIDGTNLFDDELDKKRVKITKGSTACKHNILS